jgi:hypothetical protein
MVDSTYQIFVDLDATALEGGYVWVGAEYDNPEARPIPVFWDAEHTIVALQPLRTSGGYIVRDGTPADVFTAANTYSIVVNNSRQQRVFYTAIAGGGVAASRVAFPIPSGPVGPDGAAGPSGPANSTYATLAQLKAAAPSNLSYFLADPLSGRLIGYRYTLGDFTGRADDAVVIKLNSVPLTTGALVLQLDDFADRPVGVTATSTALQNHTAFTDLFGTPRRGKIELDARTYSLDDGGFGSLLFNLSNVIVRGVPGKTVISASNFLVAMYLGSVSNVVFENIIFESLKTGGTVSIYGIVTSLGASLENIRFINCGFRGPETIGAAGNGVKLVANANGGGFIYRTYFEGCYIENVQRMGIEPTALDDGNQTAFINDFKFVGGYIQNTGLGDPVSGQGISLDGYGNDFEIDTVFENNSFACFENVGFSNGRMTAVVRNQSRTCDVVSMTNTRPMRDVTIHDVKTIGRVNGGYKARYQTRLRQYGCQLDLAQAVSFLNVCDSSFRDEQWTIFSGGHYVEAPGDDRANACSYDNVIIDGRNDTAARLSLVQWNGASGALFGNRMRNCALLRGPNTAYDASEVGMAYDNRVVSSTPFPLALAGDADPDLIKGIAPVLYGTNAITLTSTVTLAAPTNFYMPPDTVAPVRVKNSTTGAQVIRVHVLGQSSYVEIANGASKLLYSNATTVLEL